MSRLDFNAFDEWRTTVTTWVFKAHQFRQSPVRSCQFGHLTSGKLKPIEELFRIYFNSQKFVMSAVFLPNSCRDFHPISLILSAIAMDLTTENKRRISPVQYFTMFQGPSSVWRDFVVTCKGCRENIAASIETLPDDWIIEACPFCPFCGATPLLPARDFQRQDFS